MGHVLTIGTFDGVHAGHRALVARAREMAGEALAYASGSLASGSSRVTALVFDPHPATVLNPEGGAPAPGRLSSFESRRQLLLEAGADEVVRLKPTLELLGQTPRQFVEHLVKTYAPAGFVEGPDFRFGRARAGDVVTLDDLGREMGFVVDVITPIGVTLTDHTIVTASSTMVRWLLSHGRVRDAELVLKRPYRIEGRVECGDRRGRTIGFPTANLGTDYLLPGDGIYACRALLPDGREVAAGVHVGPRDTFGDSKRVLEAHLIGVERGGGGPAIAGLPEYGWDLKIDFVAWLRDPARFASVEALVDQMKLDCERAAEIVVRGKRPQEVRT